MKKMSTLELIQDTLDFYTKDPSRLSRKGVDEQCMYRSMGPKGEVRRCAVGRLISKRKYTPEIESTACCASEVACLLPRWVNISALQDIQTIHDSYILDDGRVKKHATWTIESALNYAIDAGEVLPPNAALYLGVLVP